ncbi:hypothetical protein AAG906_007463 [Vitis piasezkii]
MALWLYGEHGVKKNKILVYNKVARLDEDQETSKLKETEKISLWDMNVGKFPETLVCPNLKTLFVQKCHNLKKFPSGFFQFMLLLRVLDLSTNDNLSELPTEIGKLGALRYLNLSNTRIRELPIELKNLKNLMILLMDDMKSLEIIPQDVISSLISLKLFSLYESNITSGVEETLLEELESLNDISEISTTISNALSFNKLKSSHKLQRCWGSSRQALVGIHVFAGIGFCGLPLAFDVGWLLVICLLYADAGIFMVVALLVLGRQLVACVSSAL